MDVLQDYFWDFAQINLPPTVYDTLYTFAGHLTTVFYALNGVLTWIYKYLCVYAYFCQRPMTERLVCRTGTQEIERLSFAEQILPPVLSIIAIYFGIVSIYRTTASVVRTTISLVKWAFIIALLAMGAGYFAANGNIDTDLLLRLASQFAVPQERILPHEGERTGRATHGGRTRTQRGQGSRRPSLFEPFVNHQEWRDAQRQAGDTQEYVQEVVKGAQKVFKDGSSFLDTLFNRRSRDEDGDDYLDDGTRRPRTRSQTRRTGRRNAGF